MRPKISSERTTKGQPSQQEVPMRRQVGLYLQLRQTLDGLQRPQHSQNPERLDGADILPLTAPPTGHPGNSMGSEVGRQRGVMEWRAVSPG